MKIRIKRHIAVLAILALASVTAYVVQQGEASNASYGWLLQDADLSVVTQNMYIPRFYDKLDRVHAVGQEAFEQKADVVLLQEILFPYEVSFLNNEYHVYYENGRFGPKGGLVTLSEHAASSISFIKFEEQGASTIKQFIESIIEKGILIVRFEDATVINTHLVSVGDKKPGSRERRANLRQFDQLLEVIEQELKRDVPLIVGGDFNLEVNSVPYRHLTTVLQDVSKGAHLMVQEPNRPAQIDFIFSNMGSLSELNLFDYDQFVSDHPGIFSNLELS